MMAKEFKNSSRQWKIQLGIIRCGQVPLIRKWTVQWRYSLAAFSLKYEGWIIHLHLVYYDIHKNLIISFYFILDKVTKQKGKNLVQLKLNKGNVAYTAKVIELKSLQGLEKYVMTKLFSRTFSSFPEDAKTDLEVSQKIHLLQTFLKPEHLDIPLVLRNETSWLVSLLHFC